MLHIVYGKPLDEVMRECQNLPRNRRNPKSLHNHILTQIHNKAVQDNAFKEAMEFTLSIELQGIPSIPDINEVILEKANKKGETIHDILQSQGILELAKRFHESDKKKERKEIK